MATYWINDEELQVAMMAFYRAGIMGDIGYGWFIVNDRRIDPARIKAIRGDALITVSINKRDEMIKYYSRCVDLCPESHDAPSVAFARAWVALGQYYPELYVAHGLADRIAAFEATEAA